MFIDGPEFMTGGVQLCENSIQFQSQFVRSFSIYSIIDQNVSREFLFVMSGESFSNSIDHVLYLSRLTLRLSLKIVYDNDSEMKAYGISSSGSIMVEISLPACNKKAIEEKCRKCRTKKNFFFISQKLAHTSEQPSFG